MADHKLSTGRGVGALLIVMSLTVAACGLSPVEPSGADSDIQFIVSPTEPIRSGSVIVYSFSFTVANPNIGVTVHLNSLDYVLRAGDNSIYASGTTPFNTDLTPGSSIGGGGGTFVDSNTTRPLATRYTVRMSFRRADGSAVTLERESKILPLK